jgi:hypothetical protein
MIFSNPLDGHNSKTLLCFSHVPVSSNDYFLFALGTRPGSRRISRRKPAGKNCGYPPEKNAASRKPAKKKIAA